MKREPAQDQKTPGSTGDVEPEVNKELAELRALNQVTLVGESEEGHGPDHLPAGVYGFSSSPQDAAPLFQHKIFRSFEVHKLIDGTVHVIGYVTAQQAGQLSSGDSYVDVDLYPDPFREAESLVSIPKSRIVRAKEPSRAEGNAVRLEVRPLSEAIN